MQPIKNWPSILTGAALLLALGATAAWMGTAGAAPAAAVPAAASFADPAFERVWGRTDYLVAGGPGRRAPGTGGRRPSALLEPYAEGPGRVRQVQYFDKSRMEINDPTATRHSWYVTNGLLTIELISGRMQVGDTHWCEAARPAAHPAGLGHRRRERADLRQLRQRGEHAAAATTARPDRPRPAGRRSDDQPRRAGAPTPGKAPAQRLLRVTTSRPPGTTSPASSGTS